MQTIELDSVNKIVIIKNVLSQDTLNSFKEYQKSVKRVSGKSAYGKPKPRKEVAFTFGGAFKYSNRKHYTEKFNPTIEAMSEILALKIGPDYILDQASDIEYGPEFKFGGSIAKHQDNEHPWNMVLIFSMGQTRTLKINGDHSVSVDMEDNSIVAMVGRTFQKKYWHRVDKLNSKIAPQWRNSLNIRYY